LLADRTNHRRAIELAIRGMPAVSTAAIDCAYSPTRPRTTSGRSSPPESGPTPFINRENRVGVSSHDKQQMAVNLDGAVDIHIWPTAPEDLANNWIPTTEKDFWLMMRFYGPDKALFDKTWVMPDVEKVR
jgi:hypothetical protein